jgi:hypothetical protein
MPRRAIPDPLKRRHLVESALDPARALAIAEAYLEEGRRLEAAADALGEPPDAEAWERTARRAADAGREHDATEAERQAARLRAAPS